MRTGAWRGERVGACTDCRRYYAGFREGRIGEEELRQVQQQLCSTPGTCMVMGSASTIACLAETVGLMLPGGASPTSGSADRLRNAVATGRRAALLAREPITPGRILTREAFENALTVLIALGGSTNTIIHLTAIAAAGRRRAVHGRFAGGLPSRCRCWWTASPPDRATWRTSTMPADCPPC